MRKAGWILLLFLLLFGNLYSQVNLVPNPSFEDYDTCPQDLSYFTPSVDYWFTPMSKMLNPPPQFSLYNWGSSDYYNNCANNPKVQIPENYLGKQDAIFGNAYSGITLLANDFQTNINISEYIETELKEALVANKKYQIEFYYSIADYMGIDEYLPIDIGLLITDTVQYREEFLNQFGVIQPYNINTIPQIRQSLPEERDTLNWIKVRGSFVAKGGEKYLTIGNFQNTDSIYARIYVYIDSVSLWLDEDTVPVAPEKELKVYPSPLLPGNTLQIEYINGDLKDYCLRLYNSLGQMVYKERFTEAGEKREILLPSLAPGTYFYRLEHFSEVEFRGKVIVL